VMQFAECELAIALQLLVVTSCVYKCSINTITNPNPAYSHTHKSDGIFNFSLRLSETFFAFSFPIPVLQERKGDTDIENELSVILIYL
jgi:hypothetical protein